eukprot:3980472-Amphidinium_carterae.1
MQHPDGKWPSYWSQTEDCQTFHSHGHRTLATVSYWLDCGLREVGSAHTWESTKSGSAKNMSLDLSS